MGEKTGDDKITEAIIGAAIRVHKQLGRDRWSQLMRPVSLMI